MKGQGQHAEIEEISAKKDRIAPADEPIFYPAVGVLAGVWRCGQKPGAAQVRPVGQTVAFLSAELRLHA